MLEAQDKETIKWFRVYNKSSTFRDRCVLPYFIMVICKAHILDALIGINSYFTITDMGNLNYKNNTLIQFFFGENDEEVVVLLEN